MGRRTARAAEFLGAIDGWPLRRVRGSIVVRPRKRRLGSQQGIAAYPDERTTLGNEPGVSASGFGSFGAATVDSACLAAVE